MKLTTCLMILMIMSSVDGSSIFNWIWSKPTDEKKITFSNNVPLASIPYEIMTNDEKFLHEASKITDIQISSVLDSCQHKVVLKIRKTCSALTEEELSKFSVNLLNCQSFAEGRKTYPCTEEMVSYIIKASLVVGGVIFCLSEPAYFTPISVACQA